VNLCEPHGLTRVGSEFKTDEDKKNYRFFETSKFHKKYLENFTPKA
jgi:hypothetical protein